MRTALLIAVTTAAGLGACAPLPGAGYEYGVAQPAPSYGYYDGGYAPAPYYAEPVYGSPYVSPGPAIIVGGERRFYDRDRYRDDRFREQRYRNEGQRYEGGYRGNPNQGRDGRQPGPQNFGGARPGPAPAAINRPPPQPQPQPPAPRPAGPPPGGNGGSPFGPANPPGERG